MLRLLRILFLVVVAGLLFDAAVRISTGTTGTMEKSGVAIVACLWIVAAWRELRGLNLRRLRGPAH
jgi:hypothetical protein